ncbi:MAG: hypothetical protein ACK6BC_11755 [Cyanobacteriota bacterium]|jgi:hypothetical protein
MSRKSLALFLATTGLITSLAGCGGGQDANEKGGDDNKSGQTTSPENRAREKGDDDEQKDEGGEGEQNDQHDEGGEGGEGGEG